MRPETNATKDLRPKPSDSIRLLDATERIGPVHRLRESNSNMQRGDQVIREAQSTIWVKRCDEYVETPAPVPLRRHRFRIRMSEYARIKRHIRLRGIQK